MITAHPFNTLVDVNAQITENIDTEQINFPYRKAIGSLLFLSFWRVITIITISAERHPQLDMSHPQVLAYRLALYISQSADSLPRSSPRRRSTLWKAFRHCDFQRAVAISEALDPIHYKARFTRIPSQHQS